MPECGLWNNGGSIIILQDVDIPNEFVQTVVSDEDAEHRVMVHIRGPLVDILVSMAPDVYGPYVSVTKTGQKVLIF